MPTVVNCRRYQPNDKRVIYCARAWAGWHGSLLGNPFHLKNKEDDEERAKVIAEYEVWLRKRLEKGPQIVSNLLAAIKEDSLLGCWCAPKACHCDVIIKVWRELQESQNASRATHGPRIP